MPKHRDKLRASLVRICKKEKRNEKATYTCCLDSRFALIFASCNGLGGHTHSFGEWETTKAPTCSTDGEQTRFCDCGEAQTKSVPATEHTIVIDNAVEATCTETGLTEGKHCSSCNEVILAQSERPKLEHTYSGDFDATCEICGFTRKVDCNHSTMTVLPAKAATCTETGLTEGKLCSYCHTVFVKQEVIPTLEHVYNTTYSFDNSFHWYACKNCGTKKDNAEHKAADNGMCSVCEMPIGATEGIIYDISADGTYAEVISYEGAATKIRIADTYKGLPVTTIYSKAFYGNNTITSVIIPDSVTSIGSYAFWGCHYLTGVVIPDSVTSIGYEAFYSCDNLTSVVIPDSVTSIGDQVFCGCTSLTSIVIGNSVTSIAADAFSGCSKLQFNEYENCKYLGSKDNPYYALIEVTTQNLSSYTIHENTKVIADRAFDSCTRLISIVIPDSVTSIGEYAFYDCSSLESVVIPDSVETIGNNAFMYCSNLSEITLGESLRAIGYRAFCRCTGLTSIVIPDSVTSIDYGAFEDCTGLTSVVIGDSVTSIGDWAFGGCTGLTDVYYTGTESEWAKIIIGSSNWYLTNATIHYNYVPAN